jgi:2-methylaconitate cis-trans-isomerase PrpF
MGLIEHVSEAESRQHTPKVAIVAPATSYETSSGKTVHGCEIDLLVRALSMGRMHHAMMGTAAVAIGTAASIPGTLVHEVSGGCTRDSVIFGHPSGTLRVGAETLCHDGCWSARRVSMSRSARRLMSGSVYVPADCMG